MSYRAYGPFGEDITPSRAELDAEEHSAPAGWFPTAGPGRDLLGELRASLERAREERRK